MVTMLMETVPVPEDSYLVGDERVRLRSFRIGRHPVTNTQFAAFVEDAGLGSRFAGHARIWATELFDDHPVVDVTWYDAREYCAWLSERPSAEVDLPSEAQWEAAARGPDGLLYPWGEHFDPERCSSLDGGAMSVPCVGSHPDGASPFGALDMVGSVWQWTRDIDEHGEVAVKGGCWMDAGWGLRTNRSLPADPARPTPTTGFRVVVREG
jgi:formylglycine-generating enzyme required for sulfatase activity